MAEPKQLKAIKGGLNIAKRLLADSDEGRLNTIREAGRAAHEQEAAIRAARNAEVKKQLANLPARNKKANEALGLYHPVGGGIKLSRPTSGMNATTVADPMFNPPEIGNITPEQLVKEGAALFPLVGDRAAAGRYLTHVGENELEAPVRLTGGPRYMDANYNPLNPEESAAWESGAGRVTALGRQAERAGQGGRPVYGIYTAGSGTNTDFNIMGANALFQQIPYSKITKKAEKEFDLAMRNGTKDFPPIPNWPGIRSPEAQEMLLDKSNGIVRTKLFGTMGKENFQSMGFPDVPATRKAIIEPELLDVPTNQAGFRLARMDTTGRIIENPNIPSDYPAAMAGQVAGKLDVPTDYKDIFQSHFDARRLLSQPESGDYYSFSRAHPIQYADDEWLNRLMEQRLLNERKIKEGEYKKGGEVNIDAADARLSKAISERMSGGGMAKGGEVDIKSADARLQAAIDARMGMAEGGAAGFKKIQFMADGGKLVKGATKGFKKLFADPLPAAERDANLKKFLEPSKTPMRLYHGTTATEGGKGKEAIRKLKPSKEGALGSGVYMTPKPNYASNYALDHMTPESYASSMGDAFEAGNVLPVHAQIRNPLILGDTGERIDPAAEALMKLGMDKEKAQMMVERLYEDKGNIGKQIQTRAQAQGYDGLMLYHTDGELGEVVSYQPSAVKSAIGNEGTYDIRQPDLSKAEGGGAFKKLQFMDKGGKVGKVASGVSKIGKRLLADPEKKIIEPPSIIIPSKVSNVKDAMRKRQGEYGARRVERAADEVPNLERMYQEEALKQAFGGDNAKAMMTINPKDFEKYAMPLPMNLANDKAYFKAGARNPTMREAFMDSGLTNEQWHELNDIQKMDVFNKYNNKVSKMAINEPMEFDQYLKHLADLDDGFEDVPFLQINKQEQGLPLTPFISGHEGRHRNRALAGRGEEKSLVQLIPRAELREPFPRRSQEEYLEALKKELEMTGNKVRPEAEDVYGDGQIQQIKRGLIELPDLYAEGGGAFKTLQFKDAQHFDGGGIAIPEMNNSFEGSRREPLLTEKDWANIKRNAPEVYEWAKQNVKDEASQLKTARGVKDFALRTGAQYLGGIPDLINLGLMGVDALADTSLSSEKPWFGSEQYIEALKKSGAVGENEFPIAETVAGVLAPAGLIKKGVKQLRKPRSKQEPKKRRGGLTAMSR